MTFILFARNLTFCNSSAVETMKVMVDTNTCQKYHQSLSKQKTLEMKSEGPGSGMDQRCLIASLHHQRHHHHPHHITAP